MPAQERGPTSPSRTITKPAFNRAPSPRGRYTERIISTQPKKGPATKEINEIRRNSRLFAKSVKTNPELSEREQYWTSQVRELRRSRRHPAHKIDVFVGRALAQQEHETTNAKKDARKDPLTTLENRTGIEERFREVLSRSERNNEPFSIAAIDLDRFKDINDSYGHGCGDVVLRKTAAHLRSNGRAHDIWGRMGGEEFIGILPGETTTRAIRAMERQRIHLPVAIDNGLKQAGELRVNRNITMSIGVATFDKQSYEERFGTRAEQLRRILIKKGMNLSEMAKMDHNDRVAILKNAEKTRQQTIFIYLTQKADRALYKAKELGRDKTVAAMNDANGEEFFVEGRAMPAVYPLYDRMST